MTRVCRVVLLVLFVLDNSEIVNYAAIMGREPSNVCRAAEWRVSTDLTELGSCEITKAVAASLPVRLAAFMVWFGVVWCGEHPTEWHCMSSSCTGCHCTLWHGVHS
jgi:hypothetical protein